MSEVSSVKKRIVGRNPASQAVLEIRYDAALLAVDELIEAPDVVEYVSPGFIDLQVNGFAGVDYNDPDSSHEAIARSIRTMFESGVTRFFPTLITGSEERIIGALRNLVAARKSFSYGQRTVRYPLRQTIAISPEGRESPRKYSRSESRGIASLVSRKPHSLANA